MADGTVIMDGAIMDGADGVGEAGGPESVSISVRDTATTDTGTIRTMDMDTIGIIGGIIATGATTAITIAISFCFEDWPQPGTT